MFEVAGRSSGSFFFFFTFFGGFLATLRGRKIVDFWVEIKGASSEIVLVVSCIVDPDSAAINAPSDGSSSTDAL